MIVHLDDSQLIQEGCLPSHSTTPGTKAAIARCISPVPSQDAEEGNLTEADWIITAPRRRGSRSRPLERRAANLGEIHMEFLLVCLTFSCWCLHAILARACLVCWSIGARHDCRARDPNSMSLSVCKERHQQAYPGSWGCLWFP